MFLVPKRGTKGILFVFYRDYKMGIRSKTKFAIFVGGGRE